MFYAKVRIYKPEGHTPDGRMFVNPGWLDWQEVPYVEPVECHHHVSMCRGCVDSWEIDHEVQLPSLV